MFYMHGIGNSVVAMKHFTLTETNNSRRALRLGTENWLRRALSVTECLRPALPYLNRLTAFWEA